MLYGIYLGYRSTTQQVGKSQAILPISRLKHPIFLIFLFMIFYTALHVLTWAMSRYRLPVDAVTMPLVALALERTIPFLWERIRR
jgi:hypothetical protein